MKLLLRLLPVVAGLAILSGCATPTPTTRAYHVTAYKPRNPDNVRVKVSLSHQNIYVLEGDRLLMSAATCVGTPDHPTPSGNFRIFNKIEQKRSGSYGFRVQGDRIVGAKSGDPVPGRYVGYPMGFWCEFAPAYGFHEGFVHPVPRTHGCLRMHKEAASRFYELVRIGTPVNVASSQPEDAIYGTKVQRLDQSRDPDPAPGLMVSSAAFSKPPGPLLIEQ